MKLFSKMISNRAKKGFTLVEMLIVIAVLVVILAVAVPNVAGYVRRIELMELDDSARSIFMAVQNKMTVMKQSGEDLTAIGKDFPSGYPEIFQAPTAPDDGTPVPEGTTYEESKPKYLKNTKGNKNGLVELTTIEGQLYNHNYVIEYDATTGRVFGVFYSEDDILTETYYLDTYKTMDSRAFEERLKGSQLVGYYGGEGKLMKVPVGGETPKPTNVTNSTKEKLAFILEPPEVNGAYDTGKYYFEVTITGKDAGGNSHTITIIPYDKDDPSKQFYIENGIPGTIILDSIAPGCGTDQGHWDKPSDGKLSGYTLERDFKGWVYMKYTNTYVYPDGRQYQGNRFLSDFQNATSIPVKNSTNINGIEEFDPYTDGLDKWDLGKNYVLYDATGNIISQENVNPNQYARYFRIDPGRDITVSIKRYESPTDLGSEIVNKTVNSYFSKLDGNCAHIAAGRHLQNLANYVNKDLVGKAVLDEDIDFSLNDGTYDTWNSDVTYRGTEKYPYLYNFKPINNQFVKADAFLKNFDGNGCDIKYIRIDTTDDDPRYNNIDCTGFFSKVENSTITNLSFICPVVRGGGDYTGLIYGKCDSGQQAVGFNIVNPIVEGEGDFVGGLCGEQNGSSEFSSHRIYVSEIENYFDNYERDYTKRKFIEKLTWNDPTNDPYSRFCIRGLSSTTYAGGIVGHNTGLVKQLSAAIRVESKGYAGGLIGLMEGSLQDSHVGGHTYGGSFKLPGDSGYLVNIKGDIAAGGIAAEWRSGELKGCYTTCSVGYTEANKSNCDTFVGICPSTSRNANNGAYAIGWLINEEEKVYNEAGSNWKGLLYNSVGALIEKNENNNNNTAHKIYDPFLSAPYPYRNDAAYLTINNTVHKYHFGDWPTAQKPAKGYGMFYWEKEGETYKIKAIGAFNDNENNTSSTLCTDLDGNSIGDHGYGYFYSSEITDVNDATLGGTAPTGDVLNGLNRAFTNAELKDVNIRLLSADSSHADKELNFTGKQGGSDVSKTFHYNYDFCALSTAALTEYEIRSFAQLLNLSNNQETYWNAGKTIHMGHDIPFNGNQIKPIGVSEKPFTGEFDGHLYRLIDAKLDTTSSGNNIGIFGCVQNAKINGVVVFNANGAGYDFSSLSSGAAVGGVIGMAKGSSEITNCAFTGKIVAESSGDISVGGIVGTADGNTAIHNCQAILTNTESDMFASGATIAAGGIAGKYSNDGGVALENCYSGGFIATAGCDNPYIGGIIGNNISNTNEVIIKNCYTYYQTNVAGAHPIAKEISGGPGHIAFTDCYYLGGSWFSQSVDDSGVTQCANVDDLIQYTNPLRNDHANFGTADKTSFADSLNEQNTYALPAVLRETNSENVTTYYHYGKSPDDTLIAMGDKRFGVFYWEKEGSEYHLKVCYYNKPDDTYVYQTVYSTLCDGKDGTAITNSGYGYFIGKGVKNKGIEGFNGLASITEGTGDYSDIVSSVETFLNAGAADTLTLKNDFTFAIYDCSVSDNVVKSEISVKSDDTDVSGKKFWIIPGLCAIDKDEHVTRDVRTVQHLKNVSLALAKHYKQTHDIICTGATMSAIGAAAAPFEGEYDGNCYRIYNLDVKSSEVSVGMFGNTSGANIHDTFVIDGKIDYTGSNNPTMGGIVGHANNTTIQNCIYTGSIEVHLGSVNSAVIGGIAGSCEGGTLTNCEATANINATGVSSGSSATVGGIVGTAAGTTVSSSYSGGSVAVNVNLDSITVSGIAGNGNSTTTVSNCYTHMNIPKLSKVNTVVAHPIGKDVTPTNCHYIESKNHYTHDFDETTDITKHYAHETIVMGGSDFGGVQKTYPIGLNEVNDPAYPMPAVVKDGSAFVHYGEWKPVDPLYAKGYGVFYWEKEGDGYGENQFRVRVCGIKENADGGYDTIENLESEDFCYDMDGESITDFGYGYFYNPAEPLDMNLWNFNYKDGTNNLSNIDKKTAGITRALKDIGFSGVTIEWGQGTVRKHEDTTIQLKTKKDGISTPLKINEADIYVKFNLDFCYLKMWFGNEGAEPADSGTYKYEIRNEAQLASVGMEGSSYGANHLTTAYLESSYIQTHDIYPSTKKYGTSINPIGDKDNPFKGTYNGNGYRLLDPVISKTTATYYEGLFGYTIGATVKNVVVFNANYDVQKLLPYGEYNRAIGAVGGIIGYAKNTRVENCAFYGTINVNATGNAVLNFCMYGIGGIVGHLVSDDKETVSIQYCESVANITSDLDSSLDHIRVGGIVGNAYGNVDSCYSGGILTSGARRKYSSTGGICGCGNATISNCYSYAKITDSSAMNPIANSRDRIITGDDDVTIQNCYYLKGTNYYNDAVNTAGITAYTTIDSLNAALKGNSAFNEIDSNGYNRYNAIAYGDNLNNPGVYPLAAVVKVNNKAMTNQYVHYGKVNGLIKYKVDTKATPLSYGSASVDKKFALPGETVTVTATPAQAIYELESITVDGVMINGNTFTMPEKNVKVEVTFKSITHKINPNIIGEGNLSFTSHLNSEASFGAKVLFTANPSANWKCKSVTTVKKSDGSTVEVTFTKDDKTEGYFIMPNEEVNVTAEFERDVPEGKCKITVVQEGEGKVTYPAWCDKKSTTGGIFVQPATNWLIDSVKVYYNGGVIDPWIDNGEYKFNSPDADEITLKVVFAGPHKIVVNDATVQRCQLQWNDKTYSSDLLIDKGTHVQLWLTAKTGYKFKSITAVDKDSKPIAGQEINLNESKVSFTMPNSDVQINVEYEALPKIHINSDHGTLKECWVGNNKYESADSLFANNGSEVTIVMTANKGYKIKKITAVDAASNNPVSGQQFYPNESKITFNMPNSDVYVTVEYESSPTINIKCEHGTVKINGQPYNNGDTIILENGNTIYYEVNSSDSDMYCSRVKIVSKANNNDVHYEKDFGQYYTGDNNVYIPNEEVIFIAEFSKKPN